MPLFNSFADAVQQDTKKKDPNENCIRCPKCKTNTWFEEIRAQQYVDEHTVVLGQSVPPKGASFVLLRCVKCGELTEPRLLRNTRDSINAAYENFLDAMKDNALRSDKV